MLTELDCEAALPLEKPFKLADEKGLFLLVNPKGAKYWRMKYRFGGKENSLSLGVYPAVSLESARRAREQARDLLSTGIDPAQARKGRIPGRARFMLDSVGALTIHLDSCRLTLSRTDTKELRVFLEATRDIPALEASCL